MVAGLFFCELTYWFLDQLLLWFLHLPNKTLFRNIAGIDLTVVDETALDAWLSQ